MRNTRFDILLVGHFDKGRILVGSQTQGIAGGAIYFAGMVYLSLGLNVGIVTRLARRDLELVKVLKEAGAHVYPVFTTETTAIDNEISEIDPAQRRLFCRGFAGTFQPDDLPLVAAQLLHLGTIVPDEIDLSFLRAAAELGPIALDAQGCLRKLENDELITSPWPWAEQALSLIQYLKVDDKEARVLAGEEDLADALETLSQKGPQEIVLTHSQGVTVQAGREIYRARFRPKSITGRSGRGDTCFAAYLGRRLLGDPPERAIKFAAALTTLKLERPGPFRGKLEDVWRLLGAV
jgi:sugar/nucleoside kinase (ribokinase family)